MKARSFDTLVVGGGAAGMAAALEVEKAGYRVALVEREECLGGILNQCIHNGFGLHTFKSELTGPEYAERYVRMVNASKIEVFLRATVMRMTQSKKGISASVLSPGEGALELHARAVVLAMGCRERSRGNVEIPGSRPAGIMTAGLAQRLLNIEGWVVGKRVVVVGSGDIGLIMARRLTWVGAKVECVVEINPFPSGLTRNIVQCLQDYAIPLLLSHRVTRVFGKDRVEGVEVAPLRDGIPVLKKRRRIACDTVLLSVGLIPENELTVNLGAEMYAATKGPKTDATLQTSVDGVFACGNVLHVHDLVDYVTEEGVRCGKHVADFLKGKKSSGKQAEVIPGSNVKYVLPNRTPKRGKGVFLLRSLIAREKGELQIRQNGSTLYRKRLKRIHPAEMIRLDLTKKKDLTFDAKHSLEVVIQ